MPNNMGKPASPVAEVIGKIGRCVELIPVDRQFENISVGLYLKEGVYTVWTFSQKDGTLERIEAIGERMVALGEMTPVPGSKAAPSTSVTCKSPTRACHAPVPGRSSR